MFLSEHHDCGCCEASWGMPHQSCIMSTPSAFIILTPHAIIPTFQRHHQSPASFPPPPPRRNPPTVSSLIQHVRKRRTGGFKRTKDTLRPPHRNSNKTKRKNASTRGKLGHERQDVILLGSPSSSPSFFPSSGSYVTPDTLEGVWPKGVLSLPLPRLMLLHPLLPCPSLT